MQGLTVLLTVLVQNLEATIGKGLMVEATEKLYAGGRRSAKVVPERFNTAA